MIKVLLVEDEAIIRRILSCSIDWLSMGCTVVGEAGDGAEGLELIKSLSPDLIISDVCMPELDGIKMLELSRETCDFKCIILTGYNEFEYARKAVSLGAVDYILKPIDEEKLCAAVREAARAILEKREYLKLKQKETKGAPPGFDIEREIDSCGDYYVKKVLQIIREKFSEPLSIEALAEELAISPGHLSRRFKAETSLNFVRALQRYRVQRAVLLLEDGSKKVYEVADAVGYPNYKRFCEVFKQITGSTPSEFAASLEQSKIKERL